MTYKQFISELPEDITHADAELKYAAPGVPVARAGAPLLLS
jgi:hypothetical protein